MDETAEFLGEWSGVIGTFSALVTASVSGFPYDAEAMDGMTVGQLRVLVCCCLGLIQAMSDTVGEEMVRRMVQAVALAAQQGAVGE